MRTNISGFRQGSSGNRHEICHVFPQVSVNQCCDDCYKDWMLYCSDNTGGVVPDRVLGLGIRLRGQGSRRLIIRLAFELYLGMNISRNTRIKMFWKCLFGLLRHKNRHNIAENLPLRTRGLFRLAVFLSLDTFRKWGFQGRTKGKEEKSVLMINTPQKPNLQQWGH
jgi:hypothetical protein